MVLTDEEALAAAREIDRLAAEERAEAGRNLAPRQLARAAGLNRYIGQPCIHGHVPAERYVRDNHCIACVRVKQAKSEHRRVRKAARRKAKARILGWDKVK